ncbi:MAG: hypothetical protein RL140_377 [Actinomycetota bacterium]
MRDLTEFAQEAARLTGGRRAVGDHLRTVEEEPGLQSYLFTSTMRGYVGWYWSVSIFQPEGSEPTISEVVMLPGDDALVAPNWVPWSERLADWKALQAELEAQAAAEAAEAAEAEAEADDETSDEDDYSEDSSDDELELVDAPEEESIEHAEEVLLASTEFDVEDDAEDDGDDAGVRPPRFYTRWKNRRKKK